MSKLVLNTAPDTTPIVLADVKTHLRWDDAAGSDSFDSDAYLNTLIDNAVDMAETETWSRFIDQTWDLHLDGFPTEIVLPYPPTDSITEITYTDTAGDTQTLSSDVYELGAPSRVGVVRLKYGQSWPTPRAHADVVKVTYKCGYGTSGSDVPDAINHALKLIVAHLATNRGDEDAGRPSQWNPIDMPRAARVLLSQYSFRSPSP